MRITSLVIRKFRLFDNQSFPLGRYLTVFAGTNSVGKSTLLGLIGNSSELKVKDGKPLIQNQFRTEFSEIFKMSKEHDPTCSDAFTVNFSDNSYRVCRITWQTTKEGVPRPRIIPEFTDSNGKKHSAKQNWPTLFLGLSRLYPIGESVSNDLSHKNVTINNISNIKQEYKRILSLSDDIESFQSVSIPETHRKNGIGINTGAYNYLANSAGQDNLGQILLAVESFRNLKDTSEEKYNGGLLLIDEIDATLHPSAQIKLLKYLLKQAKELDLQIVVTSHSLSALKYVSILTRSNKDVLENNDVNLFYISNANYSLKVVSNPSYSTINSLLTEYPDIASFNKIKLYTEDSEARWFLNNLSCTGIKRILANCNMLDVTVGNRELLSIAEKSRDEFINKLIILDGDSSSSDNTRNTIEKLRKSKYQIIELPGGNSPELVLFNFIVSDTPYATDYLEQDSVFNWGITVKSITNVLEECDGNREKLKKKFIELEPFFEESNLMYFWEKHNETALKSFEESLRKSYLFLSKVMGLNYIP